MNNCPKCGNPLQPGTSSCPICGTEIEGVGSSATQMTVASVAKPTTTVAPTVQVATPQVPQQQSSPQPVAAPQVQQVASQNQEVVAENPQNATVSQTPIAPQVPNNEVQVVAPQVVKVDEVPPATSNVSVEPVSQPAPMVSPTPVVVQTDNVAVETSVPQPQVVMAPAQAPVATEQAVQVPPAPTNVVSAPVAAPVQPPVTTTQNVTAPVSQQSGIVNTQPEFSQPAPVAISPQDANSSQSVVQDTAAVATDDKKSKKEKVKKEKGPKKGINKNIIIIVVFVLLVGGVSVFMLTSKGFKKKPTTPGNEQVALKGDIVTSNGYKFTLAEGWIITEGNGNVIVSNPTNSDSKKEAATVQLRLTHTDSNIEEITEDVLKKYAEGNDKLVDAEIVKKEISSKEAYLLNAKVNDLPVQIYFIGGGTRLLLGVTVVYDNKEAKDDYEKVVLQMVETLSYSDDSIKALDVMDMYKDVFDIYGNIIDYYKYSYGNDTNNKNNGNGGTNETNPDNGPQGEQPEPKPPVATETTPQTTEVLQGENPTN